MKPYDNHVHTHYAYCTDDDMLPQVTTAIAQSRGCGISLVEHAGHLYTTRDNFLRYVDYPELLHDEKNDRMEGYIKYIEQFKAEDVKTGLEVEALCSGQLSLKDEHRNKWDIIVGAVHSMPEKYINDYDEGFLWSLDVLAKNGVDVLAHPFRVYLWDGKSAPKHMYWQVAEILKKGGIAAELNYHNNRPDIEFFKICAENGIKISLGSDAHSLHEVCGFNKHLSMLRSIYGETDIEKFLFTP